MVLQKRWESLSLSKLESKTWSRLKTQTRATLMSGSLHQHRTIPQLSKKLMSRLDLLCRRNQSRLRSLMTKLSSASLFLRRIRRLKLSHLSSKWCKMMKHLQLKLKLQALKRKEMKIIKSPQRPKTNLWSKPNKQIRFKT